MKIYIHKTGVTNYRNYVQLPFVCSKTSPRFWDVYKEFNNQQHNVYKDRFHRSRATQRWEKPQQKLGTGWLILRRYIHTQFNELGCDHVAFIVHRFFSLLNIHPIFEYMIDMIFCSLVKASS